MTAKRRALFLDRDGVINVDHGYVCGPEQTDFVGGIFDLCRAARKRGMLTIVVTNQAGIARGYYSEEAFLAYMAWMRQQFRARGCDLDAVYYCPHHPTAGHGTYLRDCGCRKPRPGLFLQAAAEHELDLVNSTMIGDKDTDMVAALAAGVRTRYLFGPSPATGPFTARIATLGEALSPLDG
jgi:D-glycero-D-manno-heptose 1,7-bisphosphate phosphatase